MLAEGPIPQLEEAVPQLAVTTPPPDAPAITNDIGARLLRIDQDLRARLIVAADVAMRRAMDRAASRLQSRTNGTELSATLKGVPRADRFVHLGPVLVAAAFGDDIDPLDGAWVELHRQFYAWGEQAQDQAMEVASQAVSGLSTAQRTTMKLRQLDDLDGAWKWFDEAMSAHTEKTLFDPSTMNELVGEFDPNSMVPTGLVRQAISRAGGGTGLTAKGLEGDYLTLTDGDTRPAGGIATGGVIGEVLTDAGAGWTGYKWVYGLAPRLHPFDPHKALDGRTFQSFTDPQLTNHGTWPNRPYFMPGDHKGCICDFEPIVPTPGLDEGTTTPTSNRPDLPDLPDPRGNPNAKHSKALTRDEFKWTDTLDGKSRLAKGPRSMSEHAFGDHVDDMSEIVRLPKSRTKGRVNLHKLKLDAPNTRGQYDATDGSISLFNSPVGERRARMNRPPKIKARMDAGLNEKGKASLTQLETFTHELGHSIDNSPHKSSQSTGWFANSGAKQRGIGGAVNNLDDPKEVFSAIKDWRDQVYKIDGLTDAVVGGSAEYKQYFKSPIEAWARGFAEWSARELERQGDHTAGALARHMRGTHGSRSPKGRFEFSDAALDAVGEVLRVRGLLVE